MKAMAMEVIHHCCCGLDVHKDTVVACVRRTRQGGGTDEQVRTFATPTAGLLELGDWLVEQQVTIAAMESTGVYWKSVWNLLEGRLDLMLVNARDVKQVPGRKTDVKDSQWIAQLLACGLLKRSFMSRFPSAGHLASWAGLCPGNDQNAGKRRSSRMTDGNRWLKGTLNQCAWAASRKKDSYFAAQHRRIASRRGVKRATMAVAHSQLCICWALLKHGQCYQDRTRGCVNHIEYSSVFPASSASRR